MGGSVATIYFCVHFFISIKYSGDIYVLFLPLPATSSVVFPEKLVLGNLAGLGGAGRGCAELGGAGRGWAVPRARFILC